MLSFSRVDRGVVSKGLYSYHFSSGDCVNATLSHVVSELCQPTSELRLLSRSANGSFQSSNYASFLPRTVALKLRCCPLKFIPPLLGIERQSQLESHSSEPRLNWTSFELIATHACESRNRMKRAILSTAARPREYESLCHTYKLMR